MKSRRLNATECTKWSVHLVFLYADEMSHGKSHYPLLI